MADADHRDSTDSTEPLIDPNPLLKCYYESIESRVGYRLVLGGTRHFGYYEAGTYWPFPVGKALRRMEDKLYQALSLPSGSLVLDAGCGVGHVALYMANRGLRVTGIDFIDFHVAKAKRNVARAGLPPGQVTVKKMDYHHLETIPDESHDGVFTCETLTHSTDPETVLAGFHRILRPGGRVVLHEYDHMADVERLVPKKVAEEMHVVNTYGAVPTNARSHQGLYRELLQEAGFVDIQVHDFSENIRPMLRLFYWLALVPYFFVKLLGVERWFVNTVTGVQAYKYQQYWRYVQVTATKPGGPIEGAKTK
ncbi:S-adenosyl-L-methionine-dependent methyltransferase [Corynascus similis CBS 632.67]